ncbi:threonine--tRNA ligase [bacterium]|nr:threonine--tRNA ligase [bacterium]
MNFEDPKYRETFWHTASHCLAQAVVRLYPDVKLAIGPAIEEGFYYDFDTLTPFSPEDLVKIEEEMKKIAEADYKLEREEWPREKALEYFKEKDQTYKVEIIEDLDAKEVSVYKQGEFLDLCRGPHLESTGPVKAVKLLSVAGAYWRGDEHRPMLQRIYGVAFPTQAQLDEYLNYLEEAKRRDHRVLLKDMDLGSFHEELGPGLMVWHPRGACIRNEIENFWRNEHLKNGYDLVYSPHVGKSTLWETSGHLSFYRENMFPSMDVPLDNDQTQEYFVKPMNCPFHILIYKNKTRSYRNLPMRMAELGTVYRFERSGVLHGLLRVRGFTQDDAHIFCREDQMEEELERTLKFCLQMLHNFGFTEYHVYISTRPEGKCVGEESRWNAAQTALEKIVAKLGLKYDIDKGGGAFYGPKIDIKIKDMLHREWQCSTIQFDFNLPERFNMTYVGEDGQEHVPYMIHRALLGAIERFFAVYLENCGGNFPLWLAPEQVRIVPIKDAHLDYAKEVLAALQERGLRATVDETHRPMGAKVRQGKMDKVPYTLVLGDKEANEKTVSVRTRSGNQANALPLETLINSLCKERDTHAPSGEWDKTE